MIKGSILKRQIPCNEWFRKRKLSIENKYHIISFLESSNLRNKRSMFITKFLYESNYLHDAILNDVIYMSTMNNSYVTQDYIFIEFNRRQRCLIQDHPGIGNKKKWVMNFYPAYIVIQFFILKYYIHWTRSLIAFKGESPWCSC